MSLIALKDLSLTRSEPLFTRLSFAIAKGDRLVLVAANGRGKSSLLGILSGDEEPTTGAVTRMRGLVVAAVPQEAPEQLLHVSFHNAVRDALAPEVAETESWRVDIVLNDLEVDEAVRGRAVHSLSGSWQRTMLLARAAVSGLRTNRCGVFVFVPQSGQMAARTERGITPNTRPRRPRP